MTEPSDTRAALEAAVIREARAYHERSRRIGCVCDMCKAITALDSLPAQPDAGAFTEEQLQEIEEIVTERVNYLLDRRVEKRLAALEAAGPSTTPNRLNLAEERLDRIENELHSVNGKLWKLEPPASPAAPGGEPTLEERWERGCCWSNNFVGERMDRDRFLREAHSIASSARRRALEEARNVSVRARGTSSEYGNGWIAGCTAFQAAIDALLAREGKDGGG